MVVLFFYGTFLKRESGIYSKFGLGTFRNLRINTVYNVMLVDNWMFRFLSFKFIFDLVAYKDRMYFGIYLSTKITKTVFTWGEGCLLYTSPSPRDQRGSRMPSSA